VDHEIIFPLSGFTSTQQLDTVGLNTPTDFRPLLVRNLIEEAEKSQDRHTPRLVGRPSSGAKIV
jgi:hypothetical protein